MKTGLGGGFNLHEDGCWGPQSEHSSPPSVPLRRLLGPLFTSPKGQGFQGHSVLPSFIHSSNMCKGPLNSGNWGFNPHKQCTVPTLKDV